MSPDNISTAYGYLGVAVGALLEGETALLLGGLAAFHGILTISGVMVAGFVGGITGDQVYFYLGRRHGPRVLATRPRCRQLVSRVTALMQRNSDLFIFGFRFLYGLRVVSPLMIGLTAVSAGRYTVINVLGGIVWAVSITALAVLLGQGVEALVANFQRLQLGLAVAAGALALAWWLTRRRRDRRLASAAAPETR